MSLRAPFSLYPVFQRAQVKNGGPLQTEVNIPTSEAVLQQASVVGWEGLGRSAMRQAPLLILVKVQFDEDVQ